MMKQLIKTKFFPAALILVAQIGLVIFSYNIVRGTSTTPVVTPAEFPPESSGATNCRYGAAAVSSAHVDWLDDLGAGWYLIFGAAMSPAPNNAEYVGQISVKQDKDANGNYLPTYSASPAPTPASLGALLDMHPGALWLVGNEVDRGPNPGQTQGGQGDTYPDVYARAYHDIYHFIKSWDPTAQVAISSLVQVTPNRLQYLDNLWDSYIDQFGGSIPVDVWNMHLYVLPEVDVNGNPNAIANIALGTDPALGKKESGGNSAKCSQSDVYCFAEHDDIAAFAEQVVAMRTWMWAHGYQNAPLILSEFSILYPYSVSNGDCSLKDEYGQCFTPQRVTNFLNKSFDYLTTASDPVIGYPLDNYRLVQQSMWFSINRLDGAGYVSNLVADDLSGLTQVGQAFQARANLPGTINLFPTKVENPVVNSNGGSASATLVVRLRNNGDTAPGQQFFVTFYKDANLTQLIGTAVIAAPNSTNAGMTGCARRELSASVVWNDGSLTPGQHRYWVKVDSSNLVAESNESDNVMQGFVIVDGAQISMPYLIR